MEVVWGTERFKPDMVSVDYTSRSAIETEEDEKRGLSRCSISNQDASVATNEETQGF